MYLYIKRRMFNLHDQIYPINIKGSAGSLVTVNYWIFSWMISYTYNLMAEWSLSGTPAPKPLNCFIPFNFDYNNVNGGWSSNIFHVCEYMWFNDFIRDKASTRDKGPKSRNNSKINKFTRPI